MMRALVVLVLLSVPVHAAEAIDPDVLAVREAAWRAWFGGDEVTRDRLVVDDEHDPARGHRYPAGGPVRRSDTSASPSR